VLSTPSQMRRHDSRMFLNAAELTKADRVIPSFVTSMASAAE